jgi:hypothetical protein
MRRFTLWLSIVAGTLVAALLIAYVGPAGASAASAAAVTGVTCRVQVAGLPVRNGPGNEYPVLVTNQKPLTLARNAAVTGISLYQTDDPNESWLEILLNANGQTGFIEAGTQFVKCQPALTTLPVFAAHIPVDGVNGQNGEDASADPVIRGPAGENNGQYIILPGVDSDWAKFVTDQNGTIRFNDGLGFGVEVFDRDAGQKSGDGIKEVQFQITDLDQNEVVYKTVEKNSPYCLFSDKGGQCIVRRFSEMGYKWPGTGIARPFEDTRYAAKITIVPHNGDPVVWNWQFELNQIGVDFP